MTSKNFVITIARQYGSGGRIIGQKLAEMLNIPFYDKEIISMAAEQSGFTEDFLHKHDQHKHWLNFLSNVFINNKNLPLTDQIYLAQCQVIQDMAEKSSCVIVGRCADHVLADHPRCIKTFIHAPQEQKIQRILHSYNEKVENPVAYAAKIDKERAAHYNYFTLGKWGQISNYNLTVDSSVGIDAAAEVIKVYTDNFLKNHK